MHPLRHLIATLLLLAGLIAAPLSANAAQSYDNCTGFIDSLPATITTQGTWCLRKDVSTGMSSGAAITIATNNVTIDCNDFKLGGLAAGAGTSTNGIFGDNRLNATVRHCNIRGFFRGVWFPGSDGGGHLVEDNRIGGNTLIGLEVAGDGSMVRRNQITDTGGSTAFTGFAYGIIAYYAVDVLDNTISGVLPSARDGQADGYGYAYGIYTGTNPSGSISGNRVSGLAKPNINGQVFGIYNSNSRRISLRGNDVIGDGSVASFGLYCDNSSGSARDNSIGGFVYPVQSCGSLNNVIVP